MPPLNIMGIAVCPLDAAAFDAKAAWQVIEKALASLCASGAARLTRLENATEITLKRALQGDAIDVLHCITDIRCQRAAQLGTLTLLNSQGRQRLVSVQSLASLLQQNNAPRLLILQAATVQNSGVHEFGALLAELTACTLITTTALNATLQASLLASLYNDLAMGANVMPALQTAIDRLPMRGESFDPSSISVHGNAQRPVTRAATISANANTIASAVIMTAVQAAAAPLPSEPSVAELARQRSRELLAQKRASGEFDVFLCHHWDDKPAVKRIAQTLQERGILPWLDEWELPPGQPWQRLLEQQIQKIRSAAVFVGSAGIGPWQHQELDAFLREFVNRQSPVIPVLLTSASQQPQLPMFLNAMTWVDFRVNDPDPLARLLWGITGKRDEWLATPA